MGIWCQNGPKQDVKKMVKNGIQKRERKSDTSRDKDFKKQKLMRISVLVGALNYCHIATATEFESLNITSLISHLHFKVPQKERPTKRHDSHH